MLHLARIAVNVFYGPGYKYGGIALVFPYHKSPLWSKVGRLTTCAFSMDSLSDEQIIAGFAYLPAWEFPFGVPIAVSPQITTGLDVRRHGMDDLDQLPKEMQLQILQHCDLQTLSRLMRTSFKWLDMTLCLPSYHEVLHHCRAVVASVHRLGIMTRFSLSHFQRLLRSSRCESCGSFGSYIFPVTFQRCCWICSKLNPIFWVMVRNSIEDCFALSWPNVAALPPVFHTGDSLDEVLVQVTDARARAEAIHGSHMDTIAQSVGSRAGDPHQVHSHRSMIAYYTHALKADLKMGYHDPTLVDTGSLSMFEGRQMSIVLQLSPFDGVRLNEGCWCRGCAYLAWTARRNPAIVMEVGVLTKEQAESIDLQEWALRAASRE